MAQSASVKQIEACVSTCKDSKRIMFQCIGNHDQEVERAMDLVHAAFPVKVRKIEDVKEIGDSGEFVFTRFMTPSFSAGTVNRIVRAYFDALPCGLVKGDCIENAEEQLNYMITVTVPCAKDIKSKKSKKRTRAKKA